MKSRQFFGNARVELDWTLADYDEIPDVKYAKLAKEREEKLSSIDPYFRNETTESMLNSRKLLVLDQNYCVPSQKCYLWAIQMLENLL